MTDQPLPLFFPEALQDLKVLTPRLRALDFSLADLAWLRNVELASHTHRAAQPDPMTVESIALRVKDSQPEPLAGSFMLHPTPVDQKAVLYTPYGGLQKFDNPGAAIQTLQASLKDPGKRLELLRLLPIAWRHSWPDDNSFSLSHEVIDEPVFEHQGRQFAASQRNNLSLMREQLEQLPTLSHLLEQLLDRELGRSFPGLDQRQSRVEFFALDPEGERRKVDSKPLTQALLDFSCIAHGLRASTDGLPIRAWYPLPMTLPPGKTPSRASRKAWRPCWPSDCAAIGQLTPGSSVRAWLFLPRP